MEERKSVLGSGELHGPVVLGSNIRRFRILQGMTQAELAQRSGLTLSTIYHIEKGSPARLKSLLAVCRALETSLDDIGVRTPQPLVPGVAYVVHRAADTFWRAPVDRRRIVPDDNSKRISDPRERQRLGALGLVPIFVGYLGLIMPDGPGVMQIELYERYSATFNQSVYRECILRCLSRGVRMGIADQVVELAEGDYVGCVTKDLAWIEPLGELPVPLASLVLWTGAVRIGRVIGTEESRTIARGSRNFRKGPYQ